MTTPGNEVSLRYANWALLEEHLLKFNIALPRKEIVFICGGGAHASQPPCSAGPAALNPTRAADAAAVQLILNELRSRTRAPAAPPAPMRRASVRSVSDAWARPPARRAHGQRRLQQRPSGLRRRLLAEPLQRRGCRSTWRN